MSSLPIFQHQREIESNLESWKNKPLLKKVYQRLYERMTLHLSKLAGPVVEIGAGIGNFKLTHPKSIATDLFANPWIDRVENAYHLSFSDNSIANLVLFDVFHHLAYPGSALTEFNRVLKPGGRVLICDPFISISGFFLYGIFHHEPIGMNKPIAWFHPPQTNPDKTYYAAQGNATRIFKPKSEFEDRLKATGLKVVTTEKLSTLSYVLSGGFSHRAMYPEKLFSLVTTLEKLFDLFPSFFGHRIYVILEK